MNSMSPEEHVGLRLRDFAPLVADGVEPLLESVWRTGRPVVGHELTVENDPGDTTNSLVSYFPVDAAGAKRFGGIVIDVTDLHRALREGAEAEHEYRQLIEQLPLVVYSKTPEPDSHTTYVSPQVEPLFGYAPYQWIADDRLWERVVHRDDLARVREQEAARLGSEPLEFEYRIVRPDGTVRWVLDMRHTILDEAGTARFEQGFMIDITDRKRAEQAKRDAVEALRETEGRFRSVFDNALDAMVIVDDEGGYVDVNAAACELFGRSRDDLLSLSGLEISSVLGSEIEVWQAFLAQGRAEGATTITRRDGTQRETEFRATANVQPGRHLSILRDVTARKLLERALWQAQKLESVGALAGGVAHDFNNMLTAIKGYSQLLLARLAPGSIERGHAEEIERAAERAAKLTAQLLAFGRRQMLQPCEIDLNALVTELSPMLLRVVGPEVVLDVESEGEPRTVRADPAQVEKVILNLVLNASEAMIVGGRVTIRTRNVDIDDDVEATESVTARELAGGPYVELSIGDSGHGMDSDTLEHVFEPFFTTKEVGLGDGLGLSTAYGIVKQSGGTIVAESRAGEGATLRVYLPVTD
jgi:two-component system cell cycle sensor histidine kinase/response regulator CckA